MIWRKRKQSRNYLPDPAKDFALRPYRDELTFSGFPLDTGYELKFASDVENILARNVINPEISWSDVKLLMDSKGYTMWWAKINRNQEGAVDYGMLIPPFEEITGSKKLIMTSADFGQRKPEATGVLIENWGKAKLKAEECVDIDSAVTLEQTRRVFDVPVYGYNREKKGMYSMGNREVILQTDNNLGRERTYVVSKGFVQPEPTFKLVHSYYRHGPKFNR